MDDIDKKIRRLLRIPGILNWARQNFPRTDRTTEALRKLAAAEIQISLAPIYAICTRLVHREISYDDALAKISLYEGKYYREAGEEILPLFNEYVTSFQDEGLKDFRRLKAPFPLGRGANGKMSLVPVRPTYVTVREGRLHPVFMLGWVDAPLSWHQKRLVCAVIRRALLTQEDFLGSNAEIVTFPRSKGQKFRYQGGWKVSDFPDLSEEELREQVSIYNRAVSKVLEELISSR